jgi:hypothetical protein
MKKMVLTVFLLVTALSVFAQNGVIKDMSGTVELKAAGAADYVAAKTGDLVGQNTVISTGFKSTALIEVGSTVLAVRPLTRLTLTEIKASQGTETINVNFQAGRVRVDVNPPAGTKAAMTVTSPSATASVRGTGYDFNGRELYVRHGKVNFRGQWGYSHDVGADSSSSIGNYGIAAGAKNQHHTGYAPSRPVGSDSTSRATGGSGTGTADTKPNPNPNPNPKPSPNPSPNPNPDPNPTPNDNSSVNISIGY